MSSAAVTQQKVQTNTNRFQEHLHNAWESCETVSLNDYQPCLSLTKRPVLLNLRQKQVPVTFATPESVITLQMHTNSAIHEYSLSVGAYA